MSLAENFGLNKRIILREIEPNKIAIVKKIKSRIISKDAIKLVEIASIIRKKEPKIKLALVCTSNICSKSKVILADNDIELIVED